MSLLLGPNPPKRGVGCPPAVDLEAMAAGEPCPAVSTHVASCLSCRAYVHEIQAATDAFLKERPTERFQRQLARQKSAAPPKRWLWSLSFAGAGAAAVLLAIALHPTERGGMSFKGATTEIYVQRGDDTRQVRADELLHPGDALRFSMRADRDGYALVFNRDASGAVTVVAPFGAEAAQPVAAGTTLLPDSAVLDASPGPETFFSVFSEQPFDVKKMQDALTRDRGPGEPWPSCARCRVQQMRFEKTP